MNSGEENLNIIVGGGLTGLTAGYMLARSGQKCLLLEKEDRIGGLNKSVIFGECIFDLGPHILLWDSPTPAAKLIKELFSKDEYVITNWKMNFHMKGKYYGFPLRAVDLLRLPVSYSLSFLKAVLSKNQPDRSFKPSITSRVGTKMYENFFSHYINKKTGGSDGGENLHEDWWLKAKRNYRNEIIRHSPAGANNGKGKNEFLMKFLFIVDKLINVLNPKDKMFYPRKGIGEIPNKLWELYRKYGGQTICNVKDIKLFTMDDRIKKVIVNGSHYNVKNLIWTGRAPQLCGLLSIVCEDLQYVSSGLVFIVLNSQKKHLKKSVSCSYFPEPDILFSRVYYPSYFCEETVPEGKDALCVELTVENEIAGWSPNAVIERTKADLQRLGICKVDKIETAEFKKLDHVYPIYSLDYESKLKRLYNKLRKYQNLYSVGRLGGFYFSMMYDSINQGIETAEHILSIE